MKGLKYLMVYSTFLVKVLHNILHSANKEKTKKEKVTRSRGDRDLKGRPGIADQQDQETTNAGWNRGPSTLDRGLQGRTRTVLFEFIEDITD